MFLDDGVVSVETDGAEVEDGDGAAGHVHGRVELAEERAQRPVAQQFVGRPGDHHYHAHLTVKRWSQS